MKFIGLFIVSCILLVIFVSVFGNLLGGAVLCETIFSINGIGRLSVLAIAKRDIPLLQGCTLLCTVIVIVGNLVADSLYAVLDPRVREEVR